VTEWGIRDVASGVITPCERGERYVRWFCSKVWPTGKEPVFREAGDWRPATPAQSECVYLYPYGGACGQPAADHCHGGIESHDFAAPANPEEGRTDG